MSGSNGNGKLPPVQRKMLAVLADGLPHRKAELHACLWDEMGAVSNIRVHLCQLRKYLRPKGQDILCTFDHRRAICYRHIRLLRRV